MTPPLVLTIEKEYPAYALYALLSRLGGFADDTNLTAAHTPHQPHTPDYGPTVTQQANDLLDVTISYLPRNNLIVQPTNSLGHDQRVCRSPHPGATKAPHARR